MSLRHQVIRALCPLAAILPARFQRRLENFVRFAHAETELRRLFKDCVLVESESAVWQCDPMPDAGELERYYTSQYWATRTDSQTLLRHRDMEHYLYLQDEIRSVLQARPARALNFGSGHGGMSYLLTAAGFRVTNVDLFDAMVPQSEHVRALHDASGPFSLIYASHSIEHVTNLRQTTSEILARMQPGSLLFIEVPNSQYWAYVTDSDGSPVPELHPPHTYYFEREFFTTLPLEMLKLEVFRHEGSSVATPVSDVSQGEVIRYLGRMR